MNTIKNKIKLLEEGIEKFKIDKNIQKEKCFNDPATIAKWLSEKNEELGELLLKNSNIKDAIKCFEAAEAADINFIKLEFLMTKSL